MKHSSKSALVCRNIWSSTLDFFWYMCARLSFAYRQLGALDKELQRLSHIKENVDAKVKPIFILNINWISLSSLFCWYHFFFHSAQLELRKKQFHVLLTTIQELQQTLESKYFSSLAVEFYRKWQNLLIVSLLSFLDDEKLENDDHSQESPMETNEWTWKELDRNKWSF